MEKNFPVIRTAQLGIKWSLVSSKWVWKDPLVGIWKPGFLPLARG